MVCHCNRVSDAEVIASIEAGASTIADVGAACRAGTCCGSCWPSIERLLVRHAAGAQGTDASPVQVRLRVPA